MCDIFKTYCLKYGLPYEEAKKCPDYVKKTTHYKVYELGIEIEKLKSEIKNALPKWLKWIIR